MFCCTATSTGATIVDMQLARGAARWVAAATLITLGVLTAWTLVTPAFRAPDEPTHFSGVSRLAREHTWPVSRDARMDPAVPIAAKAAGLSEVPWLTNPSLGRPAAGQGPDAPSVRDMRAAAKELDVAEPSAAQPPAYYAYLAVFYSGLGLDSVTPNQALLVLRLANLLLLAPVPFLCALAATKLELGSPSVVAASFVPLGWIQFLHIGAALNTGNLVTLVVATVTVLLIWVVKGRMTSIKSALAVGALTSVGLAAKAFAVCLLPMIVLAYFATARHDRRSWRSLAWALAATLPGLALLLRSMRGADGFAPPGAGGSAGHAIWDYLASAAQDLSVSLWANLGWLNTPLTSAVHVPLTVAAIAVLVVGTRRLPGGIAVRGILHASWLIPLTMIGYWSFQYYRVNGFVDGMQGRYLSSGVVAVAVATGSALAAWPRVLRLVPPAAVVGAAGGLLFGLRSFWAGADLRVALSWWPHGGVVLLVAVTLTCLGLVLLATAMLSEPRPPDDGSLDPPTRSL
jgi:hypothetical protein